MQGEWVFQEPKTQSGWRTHSLIYLKVGWHRAGTLISSLDFWLHSSWRSHRYFICFSPFSIPLSSSSSVLFVAQTPPTLRTLLSSIFISPPPLNPLLSFQLLTRTLQVSPVYPTFSTSLTLLIHCPLPFSSPHPQVSALQIPYIILHFRYNLLTFPPLTYLLVSLCLQFSLPCILSPQIPHRWFHSNFAPPIPAHLSAGGI